MIKDIRLQNFRSYKDETFEFGESVNIIVGPNASGKTNLLEALLMIAAGHSYRAKDAEVMRHKAVWSRLEAHTDSKSRIIKLQRTDTAARPDKTFDIDERIYKRLPHHQTLPAVLFEPEHLRLLKGSPEHRREFLDGLLAQLSPEIGPKLKQYKRVLAQRNTLLKNQSAGAGQLFPWDVRLSELGGQIAAARQELIAKLNLSLPKIYSGLAGKNTKTDLSYKTTCSKSSYSSSLLHKLQTSAELDRLRGFTAYGPHRDDLSVRLAGHDLQDSASRGETRSLLLSLKISELEMIEAARDQKPLLFMDDVFSELDGARRQALTKYIKGYQTFITTTDADVVIHHFMDNCHIIPTEKIG